MDAEIGPTSLSPEMGEVLDVLARIRGILEDVAVRGLAASTSRELEQLEAEAATLERSGAAHLADSLRKLAAGLRATTPASGAELLKAATSLRLFDRLLTLETVGEQLSTLGAGEPDDESDD